MFADSFNCYVSLLCSVADELSRPVLVENGRSARAQAQLWKCYCSSSSLSCGATWKWQWGMYKRSTPAGTSDVKIITYFTLAEIYLRSQWVTVKQFTWVNLHWSKVMRLIVLNVPFVPYSRGALFFDTRPNNVKLEVASVHCHDLWLFSDNSGVFSACYLHLSISSSFLWLLLLFRFCLFSQFLFLMFLVVLFVHLGFPLVLAIAPYIALCFGSAPCMVSVLLTPPQICNRPQLFNIPLILTHLVSMLLITPHLYFTSFFFLVCVWILLVHWTSTSFSLHAVNFKFLISQIKTLHLCGSDLTCTSVKQNINHQFASNCIFFFFRVKMHKQFEYKTFLYYCLT